MTDGLDDILWCVEQIRTAGSAREIAAYILRIPDAIVVSHGAQLQRECVLQTFEAGRTYLQLREATLHAVRDAHGFTPPSKALELEAWRETMSRYAAGHPEPLPSFMTEGRFVANSQG